MSKHSKKLDVIAQSAKDAHLLIVDDEEDITEVLAKSLTRIGHHVTVFNNPVKALRSFKPGMFDLAIIDVRMPEMNGFQLLKRLKAIDPKLKTCFLTAFELIEEDMKENEITLNNIECFMKKPIAISDFIKKISAMLEGC